VIPSTIGGKPVTALDGYGFNYCDGNWTSIVIPDSVKRISKNALGHTWAWSPKTRKITIGSNVSVEIDDYDNKHREKSFPWFYVNKTNKQGGTYTKGGGNWEKGGCYIATAVYGSYDASSVLILRHFRDELLAQSLLGRLFISAYYKISPPIANALNNAGIINRFVRNILDKIVIRLADKYGW
jgi:hypothetical protein